MRKNGGYFLPRSMDARVVPPIKCQGIKTKLVPFIAKTIKWRGQGKWIEPFLGSGVVLFNIAPDRARVADTNKHIITFYKDVQSGKINERVVKDYLEEMGAKLSERGKDFFYEVREQFNDDAGDSLRFLFLNRSCFNGVMRFNSSARFNVPFGHKPERFRRSYITKIVNQVSKTRNILEGKDWTFEVGDWRKTLSRASPEDFVYMDPPYIGRHADYYNSWTESDAIDLARVSANLDCGFALSMWKGNKYRENEHLELHWNGFATRTISHFYHVGSKEKYRNEITEALVMPVNNLASPDGARDQNRSKTKQTSVLN